MKRHRGIVPATRPGLVAEEIGRECVVFDTTTNVAHNLAPLAAAVFAQCDGRTPIDELPTLASARLGEPVGADDVDAALRELQAAALLDGPSITKPFTISRRTFAKGAAATAGAAVLITTVATPAFGQTSPGGLRCPGSRCVSQATGDDFCACNNPCPEGSPGGNPTACAGHGMSGAYFDSCFCAKCPTPGDPNPGQVPPAFANQCLPPGQQTTPCTGPTSNMGCNNTGSAIDGICVPNDGDSSETCLNPGGPPTL